MRCFKKTLYVSLAVFCLLYEGCKKAERAERGRGRFVGSLTLRK